MKPLKSAVPFAKWLLRASALLFIFRTYIDAVKTFNFQSLVFIVAAAFFIFGALLFIGGFLRKPGLTVISGLLLFFLCVYVIVISYNGNINAEMVSHFMLGTIGFYFFTRGNVG